MRYNNLVAADLQKAPREASAIARINLPGRKMMTLSRLEAEGSRPIAKVMPLPSVVEQMLRDLRATLSTDTDAARATLRRLLGEIPLGRYLDAELRLNVGGLIPLVWCRRS